MSRLTEQDTSRFLRTADGTLHYNEAGSGRPVVLLHGSGPGATGWSNFEPTMQQLAANHRVLAVDMPGWGRSDPVTGAERNHVAAALGFMDALGLDKAALVGNSMGGMTALRVATEHPDRVSHLITMGAAAGGVKLFGAGGGPTEGLKVLREAYQDPSPAGMRRLVSVMTFDPRFASEELAQARSAVAIARPEHLSNFLATPAARGGLFASSEDLQQLRVPTLIVHGRDDRVVHYENALQLVSLIPDSRLVLFNRCGHWAQLEHAAEFNRLVEQFIHHH